MKSWESARLGDLFILQMGKTPDRKNSLYWKNGINPWISISDITKCEKYVIDTKETITDQAVKECQIKAVPENIVLMSFKLSIGKVAITTKLTYTNEAIIAFLPIDENIILNDFLWYSLQVQNWNIGGNKAVKGITLNKKFLNEKIIKYPSLEEQKWIVSILEKVRQLIYFQKKRLEELDNLIQSVFYEMFGDPMRNGKGWRKVFLEDVCIKITDGTHDTPEKLSTGVRFITGRHIRAYNIDYQNSDYVSKKVHTEIYKRCNPEYGDVLYTNIGVNMATAAMNIVDYEFSMKNVALLKCDKKVINGRYLEYVLNIPLVKANIISSIGMGGAQSFLSLKEIKTIKIPLPPLSLQTRFAAIVEKIEQQKALVKKVLQESEDLFQRLMQDLFRPDQENEN